MLNRILLRTSKPDPIRPHRRQWDAMGDLTLAVRKRSAGSAPERLRQAGWVGSIEGVPDPTHQLRDGDGSLPDRRVDRPETGAISEFLPAVMSYPSAATLARPLSTDGKSLGTFSRTSNKKGLPVRGSSKLLTEWAGTASVIESGQRLFAS